MGVGRTMHMYRTYGIRAMQEQLPRSNCRVGSTDLFRIISTTEKIIINNTNNNG